MIDPNIHGSLNKIGHNKITDAALQSIKLYILQSNLKAGDLLPAEVELSEVLGISRPSMREAFKALEALGIIRTVHGVGRFIRDFNYDAMIENLSYSLKIHVDEFREIIDVRMALEEMFLAQAMEVLEPSDFEQLTGLIDLMERQIAGHESEEMLVQTHTAFHLKLYERLDNKLLTNLISVFATFQRILSVPKRYKTSDYLQFIQLHRELVELLASKDESRIHDTVKRHFIDVVRYSDEHREDSI